MEHVLDRTAMSAMFACDDSIFGCRCEPSAFPELDVRALPFDDRCPTVTTALRELAAGDTLVVFAQRNPLPPLRERLGSELDVFDVEFVQQCPAGCRVAMKRRKSDRLAG